MMMETQVNKRLVHMLFVFFFYMSTGSSVLFFCPMRLVYIIYNNIYKYSDIHLIPLMFLPDSLLLFLLGFVFGNPAPGGQGDVDVQDSHNDDGKIERCYGRPERHRGVGEELQRQKKRKREKCTLSTHSPSTL